MPCNKYLCVISTFCSLFWAETRRVVIGSDLEAERPDEWTLAGRSVPGDEDENTAPNLLLGLPICLQSLDFLINASSFSVLFRILILERGRKNRWSVIIFNCFYWSE